ncbi:SURF1 family protein [Alterisphingorhabdus coralli]|uniref:SURF1-like protein n=1 Tax=Alterisphingorhabdus coralli TaxID=3071408 RepID=A0AA97I2S2_9SPHN|nr:SURF1 family protein [Parasphingorhabdus sp. SCSIO 66989]WOE76010.1 SURF1 family protein [Parasphingorhabdus sp. SCSIO 66989]
MTRIPIIPTIIVAAAMITMMALGIWQWGRADEKAALIARYEAASEQPALNWPQTLDADDLPLYRRSGFTCAEVLGWRSTSGRNKADRAGWSHIATCRLDNSGEAQLQAGWSLQPGTPEWTGGAVTGMIAPDGKAMIRLVADPAVGGLEPLATPTPADLPNNHISYAVQWFLFALIAGVIYALAVRQRLLRRA